MKERPKGFLSEENIAHNSEIFDYIKELHEYLWKFVRVFEPSASGDLKSHIDSTLRKGKDIKRAVKIINKMAE